MEGERSCIYRIVKCGDLMIIHRSFLRHVLLPSRHKPIGDGMEWTDSQDKYLKHYIVSDAV